MVRFDLVRALFCVFIARDAEEYGRYDDPDLQQIARCPFPGRFVVREDSLVIVVLSHEVKGVVDPFRPKTCLDICDAVAAAILSTYGESADDVACALDLLNDDDKVNVCVHWGGDDWAEKESKAQRHLRNSTYAKWNVFSLSSQRPQLWDVSGQTIRLPVCRSDLSRMVAVATLAATKDELMKCIWRWFANKEEDGVKDCAVSLLERYFERFLLQLESKQSKGDRWRMLGIRHWKEALGQKKVGAADGSGRYNVSIPLDEEIVALFADLLERKGIYD